MPCVSTQDFANGPQFSVAKPNVANNRDRHHSQMGGALAVTNR